SRVDADALGLALLARAATRVTKRAPHGFSARPPNVVRRVLDEVLFGAKDLDRARREPEAAARGVENRGADARRADVDAEERGVAEHAVAHDVRFPRMRTLKPSSCDSATISSKTSPYAIATWFDR